jgi:predicted RecB family nuclease
MKKATEKTLRTCKQGHQYYKSSDCPTCPACEALKKPVNGLLSLLYAPARKALEHKGIINIEQLAQYSEKEILALHGMGKSSIPKLNEALKKEGLKFRND